jgi:hypothetical protein
MKEPTLKFKNDNDKEQALNEFEGLKNHPAWKRLVEYYDRKIKYLESILNEGEIADMNELKLIRARRNMAIQFRNLPDIIQEFMNKAKGNMVNFDPYELPEDQ